MKIVFVLNFLTYYVYAVKNETRQTMQSPSKTPIEKENSTYISMKDFHTPLRLAFDQGGVDSAFPIVSKIATKNGKVSGALSSGGYGRLGSGNPSDTVNFQLKSLVAASNSRAIRYKKQKSFGASEKINSPGIGVVKGYFSSAYQQGYAGIPDAQIQTIKNGFHGLMTRGFRGAMSRAGNLNSKRGYGSFYGASGFGSSPNLYFGVSIPGTLPPTNSIQFSTPPTFTLNSHNILNLGASNSNSNSFGTFGSNGHGFSNTYGSNTNYGTSSSGDVDWEEIARNWRAKNANNNNMNSHSNGANTQTQTGSLNAGNLNGGNLVGGFTTPRPVYSIDSSLYSSNKVNVPGFLPVNSNFNSGLNGNTNNWNTNNNPNNGMNTLNSNTNNNFNGNSQNTFGTNNMEYNNNNNFASNIPFLPMPVAASNSFNNVGGGVGSMYNGQNFNGNTMNENAMPTIKNSLQTQFSSYKNLATSNNNNNNNLIHTNENIPGAVDASDKLQTMATTNYNTNYEKPVNEFKTNMNAFSSGSTAQNQENSFGLSQNSYVVQANVNGYNGNGNQFENSYQPMNNNGFDVNANYGYNNAGNGNGGMSSGNYAPNNNNMNQNQANTYNNNNNGGGGKSYSFQSTNDFQPNFVSPNMEQQSLISVYSKSPNPLGGSVYSTYANNNGNLSPANSQTNQFSISNGSPNNGNINMLSPK